MSTVPLHFKKALDDESARSPEGCIWDKIWPDFSVCMGAKMAVRQAGGVVVIGGDVVLRVTPKGEYLFPKGHIEADETPEETARREVAEETGLNAEIVSRLGNVCFSYQGEDYEVTFFLMKAIERLPDWGDHIGKDVVVVPAERVSGLLSFENYRQIWDKAREVLGGG